MVANKVSKKKSLIILVIVFSSFICVGQNKKSVEDRLQINDSIYKTATETKNDSLLNISLKSYIKSYYRKQDWDLFHKYLKEHLSLTARIGDTTSYARSIEYKAGYFKKKNTIDSAYYYYSQSLKLYKATQDSLNIGFTLLNLGILQKNLRDYSASIHNLKQSLMYMKGRASQRRTSSSYNTIASNYTNMKLYDSALVNHNKAKELRETINNPAYLVQSLNNIGKVYKVKGDYATALDYFNKALGYNDVLIKYPNTKATLIDNQAHSLFLINKNNTIVEKNLLKALAIRESLDDSYGKAISYIHLAEFYKFHNDHKKATNYAKQALALTEYLDNHKNRLEVLEFQILLYEGEEKERVLNYYSSTRDSLEFADKIELQNLYGIEQNIKGKELLISKQKQVINKQKFNLKKVYIVSLILFMLFLLFIYKKRREKHQYEDELDKRKLQFHAMKGHHYEDLSEDHLDEFYHTLKIKYKLSNQNLEFWNVFIKDLSQKEQAEILSITKNTLVKRRKSLKQKIAKKRSIVGYFTSKIAKRIYQDEEELFKNTYSKKQ